MRAHLHKHSTSSSVLLAHQTRWWWKSQKMGTAGARPDRACQAKMVISKLDASKDGDFQTLT